MAIEIDNDAARTMAPRLCWNWSSTNSPGSTPNGSTTMPSHGC